MRRILSCFRFFIWLEWKKKFPGEKPKVKEQQEKQKKKKRKTHTKGGARGAIFELFLTGFKALKQFNIENLVKKNKLI